MRSTIPQKHDRFRFHAWRSVPRVMPALHTHTDVELNYFLSGSGRYFLGGRFLEIPAGSLAAFWGGTPHRLVHVAPESEYLAMTLPLSLFLSWNLPALFANKMLGGALFLESGDEHDLDRLTFLRWAGELRNGDESPEIRRIALLETEARLCRLAWKHSEEPAIFPHNDDRPAALPLHETTHIERIAAHLALHYRSDALTVAAVADAVGLASSHAMAVFRQGCGLSIGEYLARLRVSHARRLLLTTDWAVERIGSECGFGSATRFYATFKKHCETTPRAYRQRPPL